MPRYALKIEYNGAPFSGWQRQQEETTVQGEVETALAKLEPVEHLSKNRTTLIVAHRLATVKKADRIVVMQDGAVVAEGTHDALVAENGLYARLARLPFTDGAEAA